MHKRNKLFQIDWLQAVPVVWSMDSMESHHCMLDTVSTLSTPITITNYGSQILE